ncbi:hypothetical protein LEP1GSC132_2993 [Leptospira kirschneri str. 200803703]|uniref:Uncharacterized protein n=1 Tax=Leptospira kirschneri str. 200802841 TaxID=1193047 RepID=A0A828XXC4_9LEPT|nr:hypothetical protein LEP1GSC044_3790 [Leptospira kirschneri serovar Grippotyphosa str. RM52]EKO49854.1 hypothetical protein LEP1GSC131_0982 [Leptospira kirschneri str. 200802841]EKP05664.1 hypothetical protein LEP1GSC018_0822 [Leptospira kirschneri str. 2008720114]EKQ84517.1 hypothetical protein LEP1GSC064_1361 [Leptospira kirschneri serovar Grippotyphosa str. Moskva]EKR09002.1 hypothetical protein LEP1GSC122_0544 [Leptospira kirschneri serovar Valbuzzi str. 200702274]EMK04923.1 hypothetica
MCYIFHSSYSYYGKNLFFPYRQRFLTRIERSINLNFFCENFYKINFSFDDRQIRQIAI